MRMNEKISSGISYLWNAFWGFLSGLFAAMGTISPDWWLVIISFIGMLLTAAINYHFQKKRLEKEFSSDSG